MAAAHIVYLSVWRFLGATLLGVMRFIEWPTAARKSLHGWLGSDFDTGEYMIARPDRSPARQGSRRPRQLGFILGYAQMLSVHPPFLGESYPLM